ncbi:MAG: dienelactone hydrolase family protein [Alphaproteobacteria bacterium]|nr:MAG: dienelactone hydrolase family protein [Alphaproteobacteria bacterium]
MSEPSMPVIAGRKSLPSEVKAGQTYAWCSCGRSASQPFCDGSHMGTGFEPVIYTAAADGIVKFCTCKHSALGAVCDGAHKRLPPEVVTPDGTFGGYLALPPGGKGPGLVIAQEIFGVNAAMRAACDLWASLGFVTFCPDLFWRLEPGVQLTDQTQAEWDRALALMNAFDQEKGLADLQAAVTFLRGHPACAASGKIGVLGYCLGGRMAFRMAASSDADAAVSYYGVGLESLLDEIPRQRAPLLIHIAQNDHFVPPAAQQAILDAATARSDISAYVYEGVDHAFARVGGVPYNAPAAQLAQQRSQEFLNRFLG